MTVASKEKTDMVGVYRWHLPEKLDVPPDPLQMRLDFHHQVVVMHVFDGELAATKIVSAMDVAHALSRELSYSTGLLPKNTLWWSNTPEGPVFALWEEPKVWKVALQEHLNQAPRRFTLPMPGLVFLCSPGKTPWVFATKRRPAKMSDIVYRAPLCNVFQSGRVCPGNHRFPRDVGQVPDSFFRSFFSPTADLQNRSAKFPQSIVNLWEFLDGKRKYPLADLVKHGRVQDLMQMEMKEY